MITSLITLNYTTRSPIVNCENLRTGIFIKVQSSNHISLQLLKQKHGLQLIGLWSSNCMNVLKYLFNFNQIEGVQIPDCFNCFLKLKFNTIYSNRERNRKERQRGTRKDTIRTEGITIPGLQPRDKAAILGFNTIEFFSKNLYR